MKYKERIKKLQNYVLLHNNSVLGTFGNLKKVTEFLKNEKFLSYWTLIRKKENEYPIVYKEYLIFKVKHY